MPYKRGDNRGGLLEVAFYELIPCIHVGMVSAAHIVVQTARLSINVYFLEHLY